MKYTTILFDLDGTLTESGLGITRSAAYAFERLGLPVPSQEILDTFVGPPLVTSFMKHAGLDEEGALHATQLYRERFSTIGWKENKLYPGIPELLEALVHKGHKLYIATSKPEFMTLQILERFGIIQYFTKICGASTDSSRNTKEAVIAYLLEQCDNREDMVMVGDTVYDVRGAAFHGIPAIGVSWGYGNTEDMEREGAIAIAHSTEELIKLLEQ
jgi:phosphoglycolate phosphatase